MASGWSFAAILLTCLTLSKPRTVTTATAPPQNGFYDGDTKVVGPVLALNFPDPSIINVNGTWWAFATNGNQVYVQVASSQDFNTWTLLSGTDALPYPPDWVREPRSNVWAPAVIQLPDGSFIMYFSASTVEGNGTHCVGAATSSTVEGPYQPLSSPLACPLDQGGAIDPAGFKDWARKGNGWGSGEDQYEDGVGDCWSEPDWWGGGEGGQRYLLYKIDGNTGGHGGACGNDVRRSGHGTEVKADLRRCRQSYLHPS